MTAVQPTKAEESPQRGLSAVPEPTPIPNPSPTPLIRHQLKFPRPQVPALEVYEDWVGAKAEALNAQEGEKRSAWRRNQAHQDNDIVVAFIESAWSAMGEVPDAEGAAIRLTERLCQDPAKLIETHLTSLREGLDCAAYFRAWRVLNGDFYAYLHRSGQVADDLSAREFKPQSPSPVSRFYLASCDYLQAQVELRGGTGGAEPEEDESAAPREGISRHFAYRYMELVLEYELVMRRAYETYEHRDSVDFDQFVDIDAVGHVEAFLRWKYAGDGRDRELQMARSLFYAKLYPHAHQQGAVQTNVPVELFMRANPVENPSPHYRSWCAHLVDQSSGSQSERFPELARVGGAFIAHLLEKYEGIAAKALVAQVKADPAAEIGAYLDSRQLKRGEPAFDRERDILTAEFIPWFIGGKAASAGASNTVVIELLRAGSAPSIPCHVSFCEKLRGYYDERPTIHRGREMDRISSTVGAFVESVWLRNRERLGNDVEALEEQLISNGKEELHAHLRDLREGGDRRAYVAAWRDLTAAFYGHISESHEVADDVRSLRFCPPPHAPTLPFYDAWSRHLAERSKKIAAAPAVSASAGTEVDGGIPVEGAEAAEAYSSGQRDAPTVRAIGRLTFEYLEHLWKTEGIVRATKQNIDPEKDAAAAGEIYLKLLREDQRPFIDAYVRSTGRSLENRAGANVRAAILGNFVEWAREAGHVRFDLERAQFLETHQLTPPDPHYTALLGEIWKGTSTTAHASFRAGVAREYFEYLRSNYATADASGAKPDYKDLVSTDTGKRISTFLRTVSDTQPQRSMDHIRSCLSQHVIPFLERRLDFVASGMGDLATRVEAKVPYVPAVTAYEDQIRDNPAPVDGAEITPRVLKNVDGYLQSVWEKTVADAGYTGAEPATANTELRHAYQRNLVEQARANLGWYFEQRAAETSVHLLAEARADIYGGLYGILFRAGQMREDLFGERHALPPRVPPHALWGEWAASFEDLDDGKALNRVVYVNRFLEALWAEQGAQRLSALGRDKSMDSPEAVRIMLDLLQEGDPLMQISDFATSVAPQPSSRLHYEVTRILEEEFYPFARSSGAIEYDIELASRFEKFWMSPENEVFNRWIAEKTNVAIDPRKKADETRDAKIVRDYLVFVWRKYDGNALLAGPQAESEANLILHSLIARDTVADITEFAEARGGSGAVSPTLVRKVLLTDVLSWYQSVFHDLNIDPEREAFRVEAKIPKSSLYADFWGHLYDQVHDSPSRLTETMANQLGGIVKNLFEHCANANAAQLKRAEDPAEALEALILDPDGEAVRSYVKNLRDTQGQQEAFRQHTYIYEYLFHFASRSDRIDWDPKPLALLPILDAPRSASLVAWSEHIAEQVETGAYSLSLGETVHLRARAVALYAEWVWQNEGRGKFEAQFSGRARTEARKGEVLDSLFVDDFETRVELYVESLPPDQFKTRAQNVLLEHFYPFLNTQGLVEYDKARRDFMKELELPHQVEAFDHYAAELFGEWQRRETARSGHGADAATSMDGMSLGQARKKLIGVHDFIKFAWEQSVVPALTEERPLEKIRPDTQRRALEEAIVKNPAELIERYLAHLQETAPTRVTFMHNALFDDFYPRLRTAEMTKFNTEKYLFLPETSCPRTPILRRIFDHYYEQIAAYRGSDLPQKDRPGMSPSQATRICSTTINFLEHVHREHGEEGDKAAETLERLMTEDPIELCEEYLDLIWEQGSEIRYYQLRSDLYNYLYPQLRKWGVTEAETERLAFPLRVANHPQSDLVRAFWDHMYDRVHDRKNPRPIGIKAAQQYGRVVNDYISYLIENHSDGRGRLTARQLEELMCRGAKPRVEAFLEANSDSAKIDTIRSAMFQLHRWMRDAGHCTLDPALLRKRAAPSSKQRSHTHERTKRGKDTDPHQRLPARGGTEKADAARGPRSESSQKGDNSGKPKKSSPPAAPGRGARSGSDEARRRPAGRDAHELSAADIEELLQEVEPDLPERGRQRPDGKPKGVKLKVEVVGRATGSKGEDAARPENPTDPFMKRMLLAARTAAVHGKAVSINHIRNALLTRVIRSGIMTFEQACELEVWQVWPSEKALHVLNDGTISKELLLHRLPKATQGKAREAAALVQGLVEGFEAYASRLPTSELRHGWRRGHSNAKFFQNISGTGLTADDEPVDGKVTDKNVMILREHRNVAITMLMQKYDVTMQQVLDLLRDELDIRGNNAVLKVSDNMGEVREIKLSRDKPDELPLFHWVIGVEQVSNIRSSWRMNHGHAPLFPGMNDERLFGYQDD